MAPVDYRIACEKSEMFPLYNEAEIGRPETLEKGPQILSQRFSISHDAFGACWLADFDAQVPPPGSAESAMS
jgi:hypothetical protein